ncbi:unnamed protein product [Arabidopsis thaliana]|uniref:(thale cress) hypothetical protein n=1 Tax=Arabidopsis thaliana TaxID=3702 RepID=A0A7G2F022_ARATH|nr:unnamed protein product [Arabidopsis thaliana]
MQDSKCNLNILNPFTRERINLPPVESQRGKVKVKRIIDDGFRISHYHIGSESKYMSIGSPVFWIDEKTKDYIVFWGLRDWCVVSAKKGYTSWNQIPKTSNCRDMVYKDHKLYFLTKSGGFKILDFSGEIPQQIFKCGTFLKKSPPSPSPSWKRQNAFGRCRRLPSDYWFFFDPKLVVTVRGDVLWVIMKQHRSEYIWSFDVYNIYSSSGNLMIYEKVDSLGDEAMLLDLGITVPSSEIDGLNGNSIYFSGIHGRRKTNGILIFDLETEKLEKLHKYDCSSV